MSSRNPMLPPFYILINDTDKNHIKYYHDVHFQGTDCEGDKDKCGDACHAKSKQKDD